MQDAFDTAAAGASQTRAENDSIARSTFHQTLAGHRATQFKSWYADAIGTTVADLENQIALGNGLPTVPADSTAGLPADAAVPLVA